MSIGHMPQWYQRIFAALWVISAAGVALLFVTHPFNSALSPFPFIFTLLLSAALIRAGWVHLFGSGESEEGERQANLVEYNQGELVSEDD